MKKFHVFRSFQRNKTGWMAGLTLLAIVSFLFLPVILDLVGGRSVEGRITTYAESRRFGKITNFDVARLQKDTEDLHRFLGVLHEQLIRAALANAEQMTDEEYHTALQERSAALMPLGAFINQIEQLRTPEQLINAWLITQHAKEEGYTPEWRDVQHRLMQLTGNTLTKPLYDESLRAVGIPHPTIERLLVQHLLWERARQRFIMSISAVTPATQWDWFQRVNREITVEAAAVPIEGFISQVDAPSDRVLHAFFEEHKTRHYNPLSAETGFIMPMELAFQYVVARSTQALRDSITDEEMLTYYEENRESFRRPATPLPEMPVLPGMPSGGPALFPAPTFPGMQTPGITPVVTPALPNVEELPPVDVPVDVPVDAPLPQEPAAQEPAAMEEAVEETMPEPAREDATASYTTASRVTTRFVSYQSDEGEETASGTDPQPEESAEVPAELIQEESIQEEPTAAAPEMTEPAVEEPSAPLPLEATSEETSGAPVDMSILYRPFDEVQDQIRSTLARHKAADALADIEKEMKAYYDLYHRHFDEGKPLPPMPDLTGFVAERGLELVTVPLGNVYAAMRTEFARILYERSMFLGMFQRHDDVSLGQLFRGVPILFEGKDFWTMEGTVLYWVTDHKDIQRPETLSEVREIALRRWKETAARTLAQQKAEELANEARASGKPLSEAFAHRCDVPVVETAPFTWRDMDEVSELGVASGFAFFDNQVLDLPGLDFMEAVYSLNSEPGQLGREIAVAFNQPQTAVYIVRLTSSSPSPEALWERFQVTPVRDYLGVGQQELVGAAYEAWLDEIRSKAGFRWVNRPEAREW